MNGVVRFVVVAGVVSACAAGAGAVGIQTVTVGLPGNPDDMYGDGWGGVDYVYDIGTFEVTVAQYTEFLNAVADEDTYGLYDVSMWSNEFGCKIERTGTPGSYSYSVAADWSERPVNYVSWSAAARFANWLHNDQPTGAQDLTTTENGSYYLNGATGYPELNAVVREPDATWVIPSEDEWYKAAYYVGDYTGVYYNYPTGTDDAPSNDLADPDPGNNANFYDVDVTIGSPYYRTVVGDFENSESPYGTFDQGGNVFEWTETVGFLGSRVVRGGAFNHPSEDMRAAYSYSSPDQSSGYLYCGFRVAQVRETGGSSDPIPTASEWGLVAMALLTLVAGTLVLRRRRAGGGEAA